jgi:hypothetical protein
MFLSTRGQARARTAFASYDFAPQRAEGLHSELSLKA